MLEENFDIVEKLGTHNNFKEQRNTKAYKLLAENKVDTNEYLGIDKEDGAGVYSIKEKDGTQTVGYLTKDKNLYEFICF